MDYSKLIQFHSENKADVTVATLRVSVEEASRFGILHADNTMRVTAFEEKPKQPKSTLASMGIYVFNYATLMKVLNEDAKTPESERDFGKNIIPKMVSDNFRVFAYPFSSYWVDVGTVQAYWETHMDLLADQPSLDLLDRDWIIHTRSEERPPVNIRTGAIVSHSLITDGCTIEGSVEYSVLSPGVRVARGAVVRYSIIMTDCVIEAGAVVDRAIIDKHVRIGAGAHIGYGNDYTPNQDAGVSTGITVIGKDTSVPANFKVGRNVVIGSDLKVEDFSGDTIKSGSNYKVEMID
jgi:glucose-1-phosphate adenylyltransferase